MPGASNFNLKTHPYDFENLAAGADVADRAVFFFPQAGSFQSAHIHAAAASSGVDGSNTVVIEVKIGGVTVASLTRTGNIAADTQYALTAAAPAAQGVTFDSLRASGTKVTCSVTQGATADMPAFRLVIVWNQEGLAS